MAPGHGHPVLHAHQLGQHLCPGDYRNIAPTRLHDLGVGKLYRRRDHHDRRVAGEIGLSMAHKNPRPQGSEPLRGFALAQIRTGHRVAQIQQDLRDTAHANPTDPDKVDTVLFLKHKTSKQ
jgi:hypothetical protein